MHSTNASVTILPVTLSLVHIPRSRLAQLSHHVVEQLLLPSPTFLNITCNELELSIFADSQVITAFEEVAREDRHRVRRSSKSSTSSTSSLRNINFKPHSVRYQYENTCVQVSCEHWNVLQVDSHDVDDSKVGSSGARVRDISALLASAGISILYQSSYHSDFIFVNSLKLDHVLSILTASDNYSIYPDNPNHSAYHSYATPWSPTKSQAEQEEKENETRDIRDSLILERSNNVTPYSAIRSSMNTPRDRSLSAGQVEVIPLVSDLTCVGLSSTASAGEIDHWSLMLVKLVAYPDLVIPQTPVKGKPESKLSSRSRSSYLRSPSTSPTRSSSSLPPSPMATTSGPDSSSESYFTSPSPYVTSEEAPEESTKFGTATHTPANDPPASNRSNRIPFFSITCTAEGISLITSQQAVSALLHKDSDVDEDDIPDTEAHDTDIDRLTCLQIDLSKYGLDKCGLVNRFSHILESNGINHMYSATYKSANLLVDKVHAARAASLLRSS